MSPGFTLTAEPPRTPTLARLLGRLGRVGLGGVLADLDRDAVPCEVPGEAAVEGFTWQDGDNDDPRWYPQGVTVPVTDDDRSVLLVSWYAHRDRWGRTPGSRITVVDRTDAARPRYRHVLLVDTGSRFGRLRLRRVPVHAGGISVHGRMLHVADTHAGVRVFDLDDVVRIPRRTVDALLPWAGAGTRTIGHRLLGGFTAYGYTYVLPQTGSFRASRPSGARSLRYSFLTAGPVDGQDQLVVGEYGRKGQTSRLVQYPFDASTHLPRTDDGRCEPLALHEDQPPRMQGVAVAQGRWFVTASAGEGNPGDLWVGEPGAFHRHRGVLPTGPEDLDTSPDGTRVWCATEWPGRRWVFCLDPSAWAGTPG
ncbi:hypothetical protein [Solicola sp. PLA-1-18]|uniref:hypothetical protein n=1 Tax=Solicola sp. PLA-1-18 TaxID=3380532 RepID=UPI003B7F5EF9